MGGPWIILRIMFDGFNTINRTLCSPIQLLPNHGWYVASTLMNSRYAGASGELGARYAGASGGLGFL